MHVFARKRASAYFCIQSRHSAMTIIHASAFTIAIAAAPLSAQAHIVGLVRDTSGRAMSGAQVLLESTLIGARTDSNGTFRLVALPKTYVMLVRHLGYTPVRRNVSLTEGDTIRTVVSLVPETPALDPVEVRSDRAYAPGRAGFAHRKMLGLGKFLDASELRKRDGRELSNVLRQLGGIKIERHPRNPNIEWAVHPFAGCFTNIMLDNVWIFRGLRGEEPPNIRKLIQVMDLDGIEYYRGAASLPTEFNTLRADCGVLVLWTRQGQVGR